MATANGLIYGAGISVLMKGNDDPVNATAAGGPIRYLHFKFDGTTVVPTYEENGLNTPAGPLSGAAIDLSAVIAGLITPELLATALANYLLLSDVTLTATGSKVARRNADGEILVSNIRPSDGGGLRASGEGQRVQMKANDDAIGVTVQGTSPSARAMVSVFGAAPVDRETEIAPVDYTNYATESSTMIAYAAPTTVEESNVYLEQLLGNVRYLFGAFVKYGWLKEA